MASDSYRFFLGRYEHLLALKTVRRFLSASTTNINGILLITLHWSNHDIVSFDGRFLRRTLSLMNVIMMPFLVGHFCPLFSPIDRTEWRRSQWHEKLEITVGVAIFRRGWIGEGFFAHRIPNMTTFPAERCTRLCLGFGLEISMDGTLNRVTKSISHCSSWRNQNGIVRHHLLPSFLPLSSHGPNVNYSLRLGFVARGNKELEGSSRLNRSGSGHGSWSLTTQRLQLRRGTQAVLKSLRMKFSYLWWGRLQCPLSWSE